MMSLEMIQRLSDEQAENAARLGKQPYVPYTPGEILDWSRRCPIPNLGSYRPAGWEICPEADWWFVDKSGWGADGEPALTVRQFAEQAHDWALTHPSDGYAIVEEGQFQVWIAPFEHTITKRRRSSRG